jgi:inorganic pyrophosphatase
LSVDWDDGRVADKGDGTMSDATDNQREETAASDAVEIPEAGPVLAFIEIPRGSRNKYEYDEALGMFRLDRVLYSSVHYPTDYGYIPDTLEGYGDHLDILVLMQEPSFPGCLIEAWPLGGLDMHDEAGSDFKVLAVPLHDPRFAHVRTLDQLGGHWLREIETFFATYKQLEPKQTEVLGWHDAEKTHRVIATCRERFRRAKGTPPPVVSSTV